MVYGLYYLLKNVVLPDVAALMGAIFEPLMVCVIIFIGFVMLFGAVGMNISRNLGATVAGRLLDAIGYVGRTIIRGIGWCIRSFCRFIPRVFTGSRTTFNGMGLTPAASNLLALIITTLVVVVII
jgi:hypothetical protein